MIADGICPEKSVETFCDEFFAHRVRSASREVGEDGSPSSAGMNRLIACSQFGVVGQREDHGYMSQQEWLGFVFHWRICLAELGSGLGQRGVAWTKKAQQSWQGEP